MDGAEAEVTAWLAEYGIGVVGAVLTLIIGFWASGRAKKVVSRLVMKTGEADVMLAGFLGSLAKYAIIAAVVIAVLQQFGVETASLIAVLASAGLAIGLALQGTLSHLAAGVMLLLFRPFKVGDVVNLNGQLGKVDEIELFTTSLDTFDNRRIILPNSDVFGTTIENITHHPVRRVDIEVGAAYDADIDSTRQALERAVKTTVGVLTTPEPNVVLASLGASSVDWIVQGWAPTGDYLAVKQALIRSV
ncbi:MAG: mechanosensitive ion channel domain-containing protein, partial [Pseudomonadota bacterium]